MVLYNHSVYLCLCRDRSSGHTKEEMAFRIGKHLWSQDRNERVFVPTKTGDIPRESFVIFSEDEMDSMFGDKTTHYSSILSSIIQFVLDNVCKLLTPLHAACIMVQAWKHFSAKDEQKRYLLTRTICRNVVVLRSVPFHFLWSISMYES